MIIYIDSKANSLTHANGRKSKTKYNFIEDIIEELSMSNPNSAIFAGKFMTKSMAAIEKALRNYDISKVIISGWSLGGNDALTELFKLMQLFPNIDYDVLLLDSNHTDQISDLYFKSIASKIRSIYYVSDTYNAGKIKKQNKIRDFFDIEYLILSIPDKYNSSKHRACRDCSFDNNLYGYIWGYNNLYYRYKPIHYSYTS